MAEPNPSIAGRWLIDSMTIWGWEFIDAKIRGFIEFDARNIGSFQFG